MISRSGAALPIFAVLASLCGQANSGSRDSRYPAKDVARFVVDHLDVRSFPTSLGASRGDQRVLFRDYGIVPHRITEGEADLKKRDDSWFFVITILRRTDSGIFVCFEDRGEYPAHYYTESVLMLTRPDNKSVLTGVTSDADFKECPVSER